MTILTDTLRTARTSHRCEMCGRKIPKGARYHYQFLVEGGDKWSNCECMDCHKAIQLVYDKENINYYDEMTYGNLCDTIEQSLYDRGLLIKEHTKVHEIVNDFLLSYS